MGSTKDTVEAGDSASVPDSARLLEILKESVQEVFSTMVCAFEEAAVRKTEEPTAVDVEEDSGGFERIDLDTEAMVSFHGQIEGQVLLRCTAQGAMDIARGFLMLDEGDALEADEIADALGECANMVTGALKTRGLEPFGEFRLGLPRVHAPDAAVEGRSPGTLAYRLTQGMITVEIWLEDEGSHA